MPSMSSFTWWLSSVPRFVHIVTSSPCYIQTSIDLYNIQKVIVYLQQWNEKSAQRRRKHCTGCIKVEPKFFAPSQTPFLGARGGQNLVSSEWSLPLPTNTFGEDQCMQFRVIVVTDLPTHPQTWLITIHCTAAIVQCSDAFKTTKWWMMNYLGW